MKAKDAIKLIVETMGDIEVVARSLPVDAAELAAFKATPDTAEYVALQLLRKYNTAPLTEE